MWSNGEYFQTYVPGSINSHYFHLIGDKLINPIVGLYIPIIRIPIKGGMTIPNIATFDHGTYEFNNRSKTFNFLVSLEIITQQKTKVSHSFSDFSGWQPQTLKPFLFPALTLRKNPWKNWVLQAENALMALVEMIRVPC